MQVVGAVHQGLAVVRRVVGEFGVRVCSVAGMLVLPFASEHAWLHARALHMVCCSGGIRLCACRVF